MVIWFNNEKARNQLRFSGKVITCRVRRKQFGMTDAVYTNDQKVKVVIGRVNVQLLRETIETELDYSNYWSHKKAFEVYLKDSGFDTVRDWEDQVLNLNSKGKIPSYLIFLEVTLEDVFR